LSAALFYSILGNLVGLVFGFGYALLIFLKQGVHVKGKGWKTKSEAPKSYYFTLGIMLVIILFSLGSIIFRLYTYYYR
jgi:ABC-type antimicrobial peptide transport system permease subunit